MKSDAVALPIESIELRALDDAAAAVADDVVRALSRHVAAPCRRGPPIVVAQIPSLAHRDQADADALLRIVEAEAARPSPTVVGLTTADLGHPLFTFFFGRARAGGAALVSTARLDPVFHGAPPDRRVLVRRAAAESLHELGHVGGLRHCPDYACVMRFTGDTDMLDIRGRHFCTDCAARVPAGLRRRAPRLRWPAPWRTS